MITVPSAPICFGGVLSSRFPRYGLVARACRGGQACLCAILPRIVAATSKPRSWSLACSARKRALPSSEQQPERRYRSRGGAGQTRNAACLASARRCRSLRGHRSPQRRSGRGSCPI